jgi:hypothetical protein
MSFLAFCQWLDNTPLSLAIRESAWVFPIIESTHVLTLALSVGIIATIDLRLAGLVMRGESASEISGQLLPWALGGFVVMFITGVLLFISQPMKCYNSILFTIKMTLLALAGLNALIFHLTIYRSMAQWDKAVVPPLGARLAGLLSLLLWVGVIAAGRTMAYRF